DYTAAESVTGKPSGQDLREHKLTLPLIAALASMDRAARREVEAFFAMPEPDDDGIARVIELVQEHDGLAYARAQAIEFAERAAEALVGLPDGAATDALRDAVDYVVDRRH